ncbi:MAG TPA: glycosyltransferase family 4 protein [Allosphingosinicella sp.]|nr:glycosyltransferase family 4 protein [Allosphingosinicella sp.]
MKRTIVISINASWNVLNFRLGLIKALENRGHRVVVLTPPDEYSPRFAALGIEHAPIAIDSLGLSPLRDLGLFVRYHRELKRIRPDAFLGYTAKPNVWGSLAAHALGIPVVNNISGLGTAFIERGPLRSILSALYRAALRRSVAVFFQNADDRRLFLASGLVRPDQARLLPGSGIDLDRFRPAPPTRDEAGAFTFLLVGRLLWQKGVREFVEAARIVRRQMPDARFELLGFLDAPNRSAVSREQVEAWQAEGLIRYVGQTDDVRPHLQAADCIVLPSYREGLPRALLEGAAMAKPLIATDVPGCSDVVEDGVTGLLCAVRDPSSLARAMLGMARLTPAERLAMGRAGRARVEGAYGEEAAISPYLELLDGLFARRR